jgi:hypothetical protein
MGLDVVKHRMNSLFCEKVMGRQWHGPRNYRLPFLKK